VCRASGYRYWSEGSPVAAAEGEEAWRRFWARLAGGCPDAAFRGAAAIGCEVDGRPDFSAADSGGWPVSLSEARLAAVRWGGPSCRAAGGAAAVAGVAAADAAVAVRAAPAWGASRRRRDASRRATGFFSEAGCRAEAGPGRCAVAAASVAGAGPAGDWRRIYSRVPGPMDDCGCAAVDSLRLITARTAPDVEGRTKYAEVAKRGSL